MRVAQPNFAKGELAPALYGRFDVPAYSTAVKRARNVMVLKYGGLTKRPGTRLVAEVYDDSEPVRLIPFQFSLTQTYALEMGQGYMRPAALGGMVLNEELAITAATQANPVKITAAYHGYSAGDQVYITDVEGMTELNDRIWTVVESISDNEFTIDVDGTGFGAFTSASGGVTRTEAPDPDPEPPTVPPPSTPTPPPSIGGGGRFDPDYQVP